MFANIFKENSDLKGRLLVAIALVTVAVLLAMVFDVWFVIAAYFVVCAGMTLEFTKAFRNINMAEHQNNAKFFYVFISYVLMFFITVAVFFFNYELLLANYNLLKIATITTLTAAAADIGAYIGGRSLGKIITPKLAPKLSPNKTQIGSVFGILSATYIFALATYWLYGDELILSPDLLTFIGAVFALICVFSDLLSSVAKRAINIDDFSDWLGDHGGFGDRFDAQKVLFTCGIIVFVRLLTL